MIEAVLWTKSGCGYCEKAKEMLKLRRIEYEERSLNNGWTKEQLLESVPSATSVPQIFYRGKYIGGYEDLADYLEQTISGSTEGNLNDH